LAIVKACEAAEANSSKSATLLAAVPNEARADLGYALCRLHWLLAHDDVAAAVKLVAESSGDDLRRQDTDEWWRERRVLARRLLDLGDAKTAYRIVSEAAAPANPYYRAEFHFMPGWIALRFLSDPIAARFGISRKSMKAQAIQLCWRVPPIGVAAGSRLPDNSMR
jgi:soluble lytic murein transglycosylase